MKRKYHITGLSRLTGRREAITPPCSIAAARRAFSIAKRTQTDESAYVRLKVSRWAAAIQQELPFDEI